MREFTPNQEYGCVVRGHAGDPIDAIMNLRNKIREITPIKGRQSRVLLRSLSKILKRGSDPISIDLFFRIQESLIMNLRNQIREFTPKQRENCISILFRSGKCAR